MVELIGINTQSIFGFYMKLYREKYGQRLESSQGGKGPQRSSKGAQNAQGGGHDGKRQSQDARARQQQPANAQRQGPKQSRRPQQNSRSAPQKTVVSRPASSQPAKPQKLGLIGKIRGLFGK